MVSEILDKIINLHVPLRDLPKIYLSGTLEGFNLAFNGVEG
jgi:hypothetical protein